VVYVGRLEAYKRIDLVLDAIAQVAARHPAVRLAILGRGAEQPRLERRAAALGIRDRVHFAGFVPDPERDAWLARSRVCVCASRKEGFGLTVIEANAVGTPNVASDAPGLRDTVRHGETGFLVAEPDAAQFAARIDALLGDDALAERMSRAALAWSQRFDWEIAAAAMERSLARAAEAPA
jgi:glycosyltransferase involved in cell wall biosynthesis